MNKKNKLQQQEVKHINQNEIEKKLLTLQNDLAYLSEEIDDVLMVPNFEEKEAS